MKRRMIKTGLAFFLSVALAAPVSPVVHAEGMEGNPQEEQADDGQRGSDYAADGTLEAISMEVSTEGEFISLAEEQTMDNEEMYDMYAAEQLGLFGGISLLSVGMLEEKLTGQDAILYNFLLDGVTEIANGQRASAEFSIPVSELLPGGKTVYTAAELGVASVVENNQISQAAIDALMEKLDYDYVLAVKSLIRDCPYELYWFDYTTGYSCGYGGSYTAPYSSQTGYQLGFSENFAVTLRFAVDRNYSASGARGTYALNTAKTGAVQSAVTRANGIVQAAASLNDFEKLHYYREQICSLVEYNTAAANSDHTVSSYSIDPWQLVYVFDGNSSTNVVCEGYSKAFTYLCERTHFDSNEIYTYCVTGTMIGSNSSGPHMWNVIHMDDGENYLIDVTNCDGSSVGAPDYLFLQGADAGLTNGYRIDIPRRDISANSYYPATSISYVYDSDSLMLYDTSELTIADTDYVYVEPSPHRDANGDGVCDDCGELFGTSVVGASLTLNGNIALNFYVDLSGVADADKANYSMEFSINGRTQTDTFDAGEYQEQDGVKYYRYTCEVYATEMADEVCAVLQKGTVRGKAFSYKVSTYCRDVIADTTGTYNSDLKRLAKAIINYGGYAQQYFLEAGTFDVSSTLANAIYTDNLAAADLNVLSPYNKAKDGYAEGLRYLGSSLLLGSETTLRHYFVMMEGYDIQDYEFTADSVSLTPEVSGDYYYVEIPNVSADLLNHAYTLSVKYGASELTLDYSALTYAYDMRNSSEGALKNLVKAMYLYYSAYQNYKAGLSN